MTAKTGADFVSLHSDFVLRETPYLDATGDLSGLKTAESKCRSQRGREDRGD